MMKRFFCALLITALLFSLCACSVDGNTSSAESVEGSSTDSIETSSKETSPADPIVSKEESVAVSSKEESVADTSSEAKTSGSIAITMENWEDYFEFAVIPKFVENAFGEVEKLQFAHLLKLKDEYAKRVDTSKTKMTVEVSFTYGNRPCEVDLENKTYTLGEYDWTEKDTQIQETIWNCSVHGFDVYGFEVGKYFYIGEVMDGSFCSYSDFELLRVQGNLYLK